MLLSQLLIITLIIHVNYAQDLCDVCKCEDALLTKASINVTCNDTVIASSIYNYNNSNVRSLTIQNVNFNELNTKQFNFENLTTLDLSYDKIERISGNVFGKLQQLQVLILTGNGLEVMDADTLQGVYAGGDLYPLRELRTLRLDRNNLKSLNVDLFKKSDRVENLYLAWNPFKVIDTSTAIAITSLPNLKVLDLSYTQIKEIPQFFLHTPRFLTFLNLSGNQFTEIPKYLNEAGNLATLDFNDNLLVNLTSENGFPTLPNLKTLHLCHMSKLMTIENAALSNLTSLENLYIMGNLRLRRIDDGFLAKKQENTTTMTSWPNIKKLYLNDNRLSYINKSMLVNWDSLVELDLTENPWCCEYENQWMVDVLMPIYLKIDEGGAKKLSCASPVEMAQFTFHELYEKNYRMRKLDLYNAQPDKDVALVVGMLAGVLIGIPIILLFIYSYKRHWFGIFDDSPAAFSRQFYTKTNDVYEI